jgi:hypothetical protein
MPIFMPKIALDEVKYRWNYLSSHSLCVELKTLIGCTRDIIFVFSCVFILLREDVEENGYNFLSCYPREVEVVSQL